MAEHLLTTGSIFLSYTREDTEAARRIAEALRVFGVEVWFDQNELRGGDAWDAKIRTQIKTCALFVPLISQRTEVRSEGYFRREWKLAADRTHDMAAGVPFIFPVIIDGTPEGAALIPDEFKRVHMTRLPQGVPSTQFIDQIRRALAPPSVGVASGVGPALPPAVARSGRRLRWVAAAIAGVLLVAAAWWWIPARRAPSGPAAVVLMDTSAPDRVYDPVTLKSGGTNADDITDVLHDLPLRVVKETTSWLWRREPEVAKENPALIVMHRSCFYTFPNSDGRIDDLYPHADDKLVAFMGYIATVSLRTKFIVYSRHSWENEADAAKWRENATNRFPVLAGKIETWRVPLDRATFRNPLTAQELRASVERALALRVTGAAP